MVAAGIAVAYPVAVAAGAWALAAVTVAAFVAGCAAVLAYRPSPRLRLALAAIGAWLTIGLAGTFALRGHALQGLGWVLAVLYAVPLPLIPWLYAATFEPRREEGEE